MKRAFALAAIVSVLSVSTAFAGDTFNPATLNNATVQQALQMLNAMTATPTTTTPAVSTTPAKTTTTTTGATTSTTASATPSSSININGLAGSLLSGQPVITQLQTENSMLKEQVVGLYTMQLKGVDMEMTALKSKLESLTTQKATLEKSLQTLTPTTSSVK